MLKEKIQNLQKLLREQNLDGLIIGNFGHQIHDDILYYLLLEDLELGMMYIPAQGKPTLWGISFEVPELAARCPELSVKSFDKPIEKLLATKLKGKKKIAIRESALPYQIHKSLQKNKQVKFVNLKNEEDVMAIKSSKEIELLAKAGELTDILFNGLIKNWHLFSTESDAAQFLLTNMAVLGGIEPSFKPIVASGKNAANPHHNFDDTKIQKGFCVIDMGVRYKGYCSDMTRTVYVGKPNAAEKKLYELVLETQQKTIELIKPGLPIKKLDEFCRNKLGTKLNKEFIHSLGHGLGTQVHEWPRVSANVETELEAGMCITIEPGVYKKEKYGIRIEDDIIVTDSGYTCITQTTKELILV